MGDWIYTNERAFGLLSKIEQDELKAHEGPYEEWGCKWGPMKTSFWSGHTYRAVRPPLVLPSIDWSHVTLKFNYLAMDKSGKWFLFEQRPYLDLCAGQWLPPAGDVADANGFASLITGSLDWQDSLITRPEHL